MPMRRCCLCEPVSCFCHNGFNDPNDFIGDVSNWAIGGDRATPQVPNTYILAKNPTCAAPHTCRAEIPGGAGSDWRVIVDSDATFQNAHFAEMSSAPPYLRLYRRSGGSDTLLYSGESGREWGSDNDYRCTLTMNTQNVLQIELQGLPSLGGRGAIATSTTRFGNPYYGVSVGSYAGGSFETLTATSRNNQCAPVDLGCLVCNPPSMPKEIDVTIAGLTGESACPTACQAFDGTYTLKQGLYFPDQGLPQPRTGLCFWGFRLPTPITVPCGTGQPITLAAVTARYVSTGPTIFVELDQQVNVAIPLKILQANITNPSADCNAWSSEGPQSSFQPGALCVFGATPSITVSTSIPGP